MRNIFLFIRRYFNFLLFILLQIVCIYFIVHYSKYHEAAFGNLTNQATGKINSRYNSIENYFQLKKTNDSLLLANERLYNKLKQDFELPDSVTKSFIDTFRIDSLLQYRRYTYIGGKVVSNSVVAQNNFLILARGKKEGLKDNRGVVDQNNNVVGRITEVTDDYAVVMSLLHKDSRISGKILKTGETGTVIWDGEEPNYVTLTGIAKSVKLAKGDSVITSGFSTTFPKGLLIGRVEAVYKESATNNLRIKLRTAANFYNIQYAYAIDNVHSEPVKDLLDKLKKQQ